MQPELSMVATLDPCVGSQHIPIIGELPSSSNISLTLPVYESKKNTFPLLLPIPIIEPPGETAN